MRELGRSGFIVSSAFIKIRVADGLDRCSKSKKEGEQPKLTVTQHEKRRRDRTSFQTGFGAKPGGILQEAINQNQPPTCGFFFIFLERERAARHRRISIWCLLRDTICGVTAGHEVAGGLFNCLFVTLRERTLKGPVAGRER